MAVITTGFSDKAIAHAKSQYKGINVSEGVFAPSLVYGDALRGKAVVIPIDGGKSAAETQTRAIIHLMADYYEDSILYGYRLKDYTEVFNSIMHNIKGNKGDLHELVVSNNLFEGVVIAEHKAKLSLLHHFENDPENMGDYTEDYLLGAFPKYSMAIGSFIGDMEQDKIGRFLVMADKDNIKRFIDYGVETIGIDEMLSNVFGFYDSVVHEFTCLGVSYFILRQD